ncbi:MAG: CU044_5270 family protein [Candidatus Saccharibacteria bacterium]|nr:CU044_5270 family protein [Microbacteriaceae bacterium]
MDELSTLRKIQDNVAPPTKQAVDRGRAALFAKIQNTQPARRPNRPLSRRRVGLVAAGAGVLTLTLIVTGILIPHSGPGSSAEAATALNSAAEATIGSVDPIVGPGQYLRIDTTSKGMASAASMVTGENLEWMQGTHDVLYIPSDQNQTWVWDRHLLPPYEFQNDAAKKFALDQYAVEKGNPLTDSVVRGGAGMFYGSTTPYSNNFFGTEPTTKTLTDLPTDPTALREYLRKTWYPGASGTEDENAWVRITDLLRTGTVPAPLRAVLYKVAAMIPGISVIDDDTTLDGRTGTAIGRVVNGARSDIIIDPRNGQFIGERSVALKPLRGWPAGTSGWWSVVTTSVVDTAP